MKFSQMESISIAQTMPYLINKDDASCIVPAIGIGSEGQVLLDMEGSIFIKDCQLRGTAWTSCKLYMLLNIFS